MSRRLKENRKTETGEAKTGDNGLKPGDEDAKARLGKNLERHRIEIDQVKARAHGVYTGEDDSIGIK